MISEPVLEDAALRRAVREVLGRYLNPERYEAFIFGSEADGTATSRSDIDIGILGATPVPGRTLERVRAELESLRTLRFFDVVDFSRVDEAFRNVSMQHVERL